MYLLSYPLIALYHPIIKLLLEVFDVRLGIFGVVEEVLELGQDVLLP